MTQIIADRYRLDERLAFVNQSQFYNGFDLQTQQRVIVRLIDLRHREESSLSNLERLLTHELRLMQKLMPAFLLQTLDSGLQGSIYYQINEFANFRTLRDEITQNPCDLKTALRYGCDLANILAQLHKAYIIHSAIKPESILVTVDGLKLMEFYVANLTVRNNVIMETPAYFSPEAIGGAYPMAITQDVWSFGILLYELITRGIPYTIPIDTMPIGGVEIKNKVALLLKIIHEPVMPLEKRMPNLPLRLVALMHGMFEKDTSKRIADMKYVAQELEAILSEFSTS